MEVGGVREEWEGLERSGKGERGVGEVRLGVGGVREEWEG